MQLSHDVQLIILGAIIGGVFSLIAAFVGAHHEDWLDERRKKRERKEALKRVSIATEEDLEDLHIVLEAFAILRSKKKEELSSRPSDE